MRWRDILPLVAVAPLVAAGIGGVGYGVYLNLQDLQPASFVILGVVIAAALFIIWMVWVIMPRYGDY